MCNQTVNLVAAELERQGIATVALQLFREIAEAVRPPRALFVPFPTATRWTARTIRRGNSRCSRRRCAFSRSRVFVRRFWQSIGRCK
jgi:hypothetical protein